MGNNSDKHVLHDLYIYKKIINLNNVSLKWNINIEFI